MGPVQGTQHGLDLETIHTFGKRVQTPQGSPSADDVQESNHEKYLDGTVRWSNQKNNMEYANNQTNIFMRKWPNDDIGNQIHPEK